MSEDARSVLGKRAWNMDEALRPAPAPSEMQIDASELQEHLELLSDDGTDNTPSETKSAYEPDEKTIEVYLNGLLESINGNCYQIRDEVVDDEFFHLLFTGSGADDVPRTPWSGTSVVYIPGILRDWTFRQRGFDFLKRRVLQLQHIQHTLITRNENEAYVHRTACKRDEAEVDTRFYLYEQKRLAEMWASSRAMIVSPRQMVLTPLSLDSGPGVYREYEIMRMWMNNELDVTCRTLANMTFRRMGYQLDSVGPTVHFDTEFQSTRVYDRAMPATAHNIPREFMRYYREIRALIVGDPKSRLRRLPQEVLEEELLPMVWGHHALAFYRALEPLHPM